MKKIQWCKLFSVCMVVLMLFSDSTLLYAASETVQEKNVYNHGDAVLDADAAQVLCDDYIAFLEDDSLSPEQVIIHYYGTYNGCEVVLMSLEGWPDTDEEIEIAIGDYLFYFGAGSASLRFYVHKDNTFIPVLDAYESGILTDKDVALLARNRGDGLIIEKELIADYIDYLGYDAAQEDITYQYYGTFHNQGEDVVVVLMEPELGEEDYVEIVFRDYVFECACGSTARTLYAYKDHEFIPIKEAYDAGLLVDDDIEQIAEEFTRLSGSRAVPKVEKLKALYLEMLQNKYPDNDNDPGMTIDDIYLGYYGDYGEKDLFIAMRRDVCVTTDVEEVRIGGYPFEFGSGSYYPTNFYCYDWETGSLLTVDDAYAEGILTQCDLYEHFAEIHPKETLPYQDIDWEKDWFEDYVYITYIKELMTGMDEDTFAPYELVSRAQFATILARMDMLNEYTFEEPFEDVQQGDWYFYPVTWAYRNGVITGYENHMFGPADSITREQLAVMLYRYAHYKGYVEEFTPHFVDSDKWDTFEDTNDISDFAVHAMKWAVESGIISGNDGKLLPQGTATRAECAAMICRFSEKFE